MQKVLIVSGVPYSYTNRGIDTITTYFLEKNYEVNHLVFGVNRKVKLDKLKEKELKLHNFKQLYAQKSFLPYRVLNYFPWLLPLYIFEKNFSIRSINLNKYDLIILETGIPLLLLDRIPKDKKIILRMSDPIDFSFGSNKLIYQKLEEQAIKSSFLTIVAHKKLLEYYRKILPNSKIEYWKTGFDEKRISILSSEKENNSICYMGNTQLDYSLLEVIAEDNDIEINIIGNHTYKSSNDKIKILGYLESNEYIKYLNKAKCFIMPFSLEEIKKMSMLGMTSKFYVAMQLGKPILTRKYGEIQEDNLDLNIFTYTNYKEANEKLKYILNKKLFKTNKIEEFLKDLKNENRKIELNNILEKYKVI